MTRARVHLVIALVICAQLMDSVALSRWTIPAPDITLMVVVAMALVRGSRVGLTVGLFAGLIADVMPPSAGLLGWTAVAYGLAGTLAGRWYRPIWSWLLSIVAALLAGGVAAFVSASLGVFSGVFTGSQLLAMVGSGMLMAALGGATLIPIIVQLDRFAVGERPELSWQAALPGSRRNSWGRKSAWGRPPRRRRRR